MLFYSSRTVFLRFLMSRLRFGKKCYHEDNLKEEYESMYSSDILDDKTLL